MPIPQPDPLDEFIPALARMVATTSWLPNQAVVASLAKAVFPTSRYRSEHSRFSTIQENGGLIGMYDDNTTPEWAIFWAHGLNGTRPKGWTIAHVWPACDDLTSYTHLANLAMVREPLASLTDKSGPLTRFLRWHAWDVYNWKPERQAVPAKPDGYDEISWRYLKSAGDPKALIRQRLAGCDNQRTRILRPIMESRQML
jgi:hypothetical protein